MPEVVTTLSPFLIAESISCTFLRCRDCGRITRKYMMPNMSARGTRKVLRPPKGLPACHIQNAARFIFFLCCPYPFQTYNNLTIPERYARTAVRREKPPLER